MILDKKCLKCNTPIPEKCAKLNSLNPYKKWIIFAVMVTGDCNLNCDYCWFHKSGVDIGTMKPESVDKLMNFFKENHSEYIPVFSLLGGEPSLYPEVIERFAYMQNKLYGRSMVRVYTNGVQNMDKCIDIGRKYGNVLYTVSRNYDIISTSEEYKTYCTTASIVVDDPDDLNEIFNLAKNIKKLGYRELIVNFNINDRVFNNIEKHIQNRVKLLLKMEDELADESFDIINNHFFYQQIQGVPDIAAPTLNYFPDEKLYLTHWHPSSPVNDLSEPIDFSKFYDLYDKEPCRNCKNEVLCGRSIDVHFLDNDIMTMNKGVCVDHMVCALASQIVRAKEIINNF